MSLLRRNLLAGCLGAARHIVAAPQTVRFGVIADIHFGVMPKAEERLERFLTQAAARPLDFVIQLGDFCHPEPESKSFVRLWEQYKGQRYSVLGNHDMDKGTKEQAMDWIGLRNRHYAFTAGGFRFLVLDANHLKLDGRFVNYAHKNYSSHLADADWVDSEQVEWLTAEIAASPLPVVIFSHQGIADYWGRSMPDPARLRNVLAAANRKAGKRKVAVCFCGHDHVDDHQDLDGVHYMQINSASYFFAGANYGGLAPYRDPLYAFVTLDPAGVVSIEGRRSEFLPPTLHDRSHPKAGRATAVILDRTIRF